MGNRDGIRDLSDVANKWIGLMKEGGFRSF